MSTYDFTLIKENERYVIETVKELSATELLSNEQNEIELVKDGKGEALFLYKTFLSLLFKLKIFDSVPCSVHMMKKQLFLVCREWMKRVKLPYFLSMVKQKPSTC